MTALALVLLLGSPSIAQYNPPPPNPNPPPRQYTCWARAADGSTYMAKGFDDWQTQNEAMRWCISARGQNGGCKPLGCN